MKVVVYAFLIFLGIVLISMPLAVPIIKTSADYSMFNTKPNGCSKFAKFLYHTGEIYPIFYPYNSIELSRFKGVLTVVGPDIPFSTLEAEEVKKFLDNGGILLLADDFGTGNTLLEKLGVKVRFSKEKLKDIFYRKNQNFPIVVRCNFSNNLTLNIPSVIVNAKGEAYTSKVSIVGKNMNSYPIVAEIKYGNGKIILVSDPDVFTNQMFNLNKDFIINLIKSLNCSTFYYDEAHHSDFNPYSIGTVYIHGELDRVKAFQVFLFVTILAFFVESGLLNKLINQFLRIVGRFVSVFIREDYDIFKDLPKWVNRKELERMIEEMKVGSRFYERNRFISKNRKGG